MARAHHTIRHLHSTLPENSSKKALGEWIEGRFVETCILLLIICDVVLVAIEAGIDHHYICVNGQRSAMPQEELLSKSGGPVSDKALDFVQPLAGQLSSDFTNKALRGAGTMRLRREQPLPWGHKMLNGPNLWAHHKSVMLSVGDLNVPDDSADSESLTTDPRTAQVTPVSDGKGTIKVLADDELEEPSAADPHTAGHAAGHADPHGEAHDHGEHAAGGGAHGAAGHGEHGGHGHHGGALVCEDRNGHTAHHISHTCHTLSIIILCIFCVELGIKYYVHPEEFRSNPFHLLDAFIVVTSLILDTAVMWMIENERAKGVDARDIEYVSLLLVVCRLWRVVRIFHGFYEIKHAEDEKEEKIEEKVEELEKENDELREVLRRNNIEAPPRASED